MFSYLKSLLSGETNLTGLCAPPATIHDERDDSDEHEDSDYDNDDDEYDEHMMKHCHPHDVLDYGEASESEETSDDDDDDDEDDDERDAEEMSYECCYDMVRAFYLADIPLRVLDSPQWRRLMRDYSVEKRDVPSMKKILNYYLPIVIEQREKELKEEKEKEERQRQAQQKNQKKQWKNKNKKKNKSRKRK